MFPLKQILKPNLVSKLSDYGCKNIHTSCVDLRKQSGRYFPTQYRTKPLTYEMSCKPHQIAHHKGWNSWNTSNLTDGLRPSQTAVEDDFIRRFMNGTWHGMFASEIIIKRQHNIIRISGLVVRLLKPTKMYFLIGYSEELLSFWLQCPVKLELQTLEDKREVIYKYI